MREQILAILRKNYPEKANSYDEMVATEDFVRLIASSIGGDRGKEIIDYISMPYPILIPEGEKDILG